MQCHRAVTHFHSIVSQVQKSSKSIESLLSKIVKTQLFVPSQSEAKDFETFMNEAGTTIDEAAEKLLENTQSIPPLLKKVILKSLLSTRLWISDRRMHFWNEWRQMSFHASHVRSLGKAFVPSIDSHGSSRHEIF